MLNKSDAPVKKLTQIGRAYRKIAEGIDDLTAVHKPHPRERVLLWLVRWICTQRLRELLLLLPTTAVDEIFIVSPSAGSPENVDTTQNPDTG